jgi:hypothetical protein
MKNVIYFIISKYMVGGEETKCGGVKNFTPYNIGQITYKPNIQQVALNPCSSCSWSCLGPINKWGGYTGPCINILSTQPLPNNHINQKVNMTHHVWQLSSNTKDEDFFPYNNFKAFLKEFSGQSHCNYYK